jgi:hypothetical protein
MALPGWHSAAEHGRTTDGRDFKQIGENGYTAMMANNNPDFNRDIAEEADAVKRGYNAAMSVHSFYGLAYVMNISITSYWEGQESSIIISTAAAAE